MLGPSLYTADLLDRLKFYNIKATFFLVGSRVVQYPDLVLRAYNEGLGIFDSLTGHQIGIHMWSHNASSTITNDRIIAEAVYTAAAIRQIIGVTPTIIRPPVMND